MPLLAHSSYKAPFFLRGGQLQTIAPYYLRHYLPCGSRPTYRRQRLPTHDRDFLDLDWATVDCRPRRLAIISHGLEGSSRSSYLPAIVKSLNANGIDALVWNMRSCSGEPNRLLRWYHAGDTEDLKRVFTHILFKKRYAEIYLIGFSLGGNVTLKFLGENSAAIGTLVKRAVTFSVPVDLASAVDQLALHRNRRYLKHFLKRLCTKVRVKQQQFPQDIDLKHLTDLHTLREFDERFTAPYHGFKNAAEYYAQSSSLPLLADIRVPTLLVNALNDPMLSPACFPRSAAAQSDFFFLETPTAGGHLGFPSLNFRGSWLERRTLEFINTPFEAAAVPSRLEAAS